MRRLEKIVETVEGKTIEKQQLYLSAPGGAFAIYEIMDDDDEGNFHYLHKDYQGSILAITDGEGHVEEQLRYDPWGVRMDVNTWTTDLTLGNITDRGYTMHSLSRSFGKYLDQFGLINTKGRIYDPILGRFLSPDNFVSDPSSSQAYNRYTYCLNNPLKYTDPSGEFILFDWFQGLMDWVNNVAEPVTEKMDEIGVPSFTVGYNTAQGPYHSIGDGEKIYHHQVTSNNTKAIMNRMTIVFEDNIDQESVNFVNNMGVSWDNVYISYDNASSGGGNSGLALANAINSMPWMLPGPNPMINPLYGAGAVSIDGGANLVGAEVDKGIILMLRGKDKGQYMIYNEIAGGAGTGGSIGGEITRYDFTGGNNNLRLSYLEGFRHKAYGGVNVYGVLGVGVAGSWSKPFPKSGYRDIGTTFSFGVGLSPFLIDAGYNQGEVEFCK